MTRDQHQATIAVGVRDELLMMFQDANLLVRRALTLEGICAHYKFQPLDGALMPALGAAVLAAEAAHAAYEEFSAALPVQTGDAGEGAATLSPRRAVEGGGMRGVPELPRKIEQDRG